MFDNSPSAADTALPEHAAVISAEAPHHSIQHHSHPVGVARHADLGDVTAAQADPAEVQITAISPTEWRVADQAIEHDDPSALLGFIQTVGSAFEVTNLGRPRERAYFTSFDRATASLLNRGVLA
ncbi:hypothetical protein BJQ94_01275 [Cryobacterium sp. SO2]|uniref:hypothetical protein n=1 Tax=Cryobacterium sp. SO2 TaxID=1897060 RepID=UPI00223E6EBE|nr:hypothetical protein [Cryobacterium sp. SO2]WEO77712.1 hypothetical protein BJQ94_01275 [Cryobacterium sp. SO2]